MLGRPPKYPEGTKSVTVRLPKTLLSKLKGLGGGGLSETIINLLQKAVR